MADPFLSEIRMFSFVFPPKGWALCNGQFLPINQNQALFSLLGTTYGGNGQTNFALPDLRGRTPIHFGQGVTLGEKGGQEANTLIITNLPQHTHQVNALSPPDSSLNVNNPSGAYLSNSAPAEMYAANGSLVTMHASAVSSVGGSQPHQNMQPTLVISFCIALQGIFPSQN